MSTVHFVCRGGYSTCILIIYPCMADHLAGGSFRSDVESTSVPTGNGRIEFELTDFLMPRLIEMQMTQSGTFALKIPFLPK